MWERYCTHSIRKGKAKVVVKADCELCTILVKFSKPIVPLDSVHRMIYAIDGYIVDRWSACEGVHDAIGVRRICSTNYRIECPFDVGPDSLRGHEESGGIGNMFENVFRLWGLVEIEVIGQVTDRRKCVALA